MRKLLFFVLALGTWGIIAAEEKEVAKKANTCYTESVEIAKGSSFPVKVFVDNIDTLAGMQVPIYYRSEDVKVVCDSVTFQGSRCAHFGLSDYKIEPVGRTVYFAFIYMVDPNQEVAPLLPGDGLVATLWFTAPADMKAGTLTLESGPNAFLPNPRIDYGYHFWTPSALEVDCLFKGGTIKVK
ncbi:MAG: hypothetical protein A2W25_02870 [candidate division Zixibacteria bacterium RBG_16_53_22]|nr:MAG: hypothetical protein A2W25_02870 [candidate division Zixibacteria bacterium RBG_16_53_22]